MVKHNNSETFLVSAKYSHELESGDNIDYNPQG
jgi:hypothetical protein